MPKNPKKESKKLSKDLQIKELLRLNQELDRFVYSASHDLKAPLRSIMGIVNIARDETVDEKQLKYLDMIFRSATKLDNFINDLVNYSRNSRLELKTERVDFAEILKDTIESLLYMDQAKNFTINSQIENSTFYSDPGRIRILFGNFVSNAMKYQNIDGKVNPLLEVKVLINKSKATIEFTDNGEGISKENQKNVFKMFFRASERSQGSGLGLFIVKEVIKKLHGTVKLKSEAGKGSTFTVVLPNLH